MAVAAPARTRLDLNPKDTWDTASIYPDDAAWEKEYAALDTALPGLAGLTGKLGRSGEDLLEVLTARDEIGQRLEKLFVYASLNRDVDTSDPRGQALASRAEALWSRFRASTSFITPEMIQVPPATLTSWRDTIPGLGIYRRAIDETLRLREHVRSSEVEQVLAELTEVRGSPHEIAELLRNADLKFPTITDDRGQKVRLSEGLYRKLLENRSRRVRRAAWTGIMTSYASYKNTLAESLARHVKGQVAEAKIRRYSSALHAALTPRDIPTDVYRNLIKACRANLSALHRYFRLHRKALGLRDLRLYDLFVSIVPEDEPEEIKYDDGVKMVLRSVAPLGKEYVDAARVGLTRERWVDVYESKGKRTGAYSGGAYLTRPFILMNYSGTLNDVFTLTHELGHSMHSWLTRRSQPYPTGDYEIFLAEVASTFNEELLRDQLLREAKDRPRRQASLIGGSLDDFRGTFFRQTLFAEFELEIHERIERGEALTHEALSDLYRKLNEEYYGAAVEIDEEIYTEWARIPHFYFNFYVFQYATGISAAVALAQKVLQEGPEATEKFLTFLSGGSSKPPLELLKEAGVDMTSPEPIERALAVFSDRTAQLEQILART